MGLRKKTAAEKFEDRTNRSIGRDKVKSPGGYWTNVKRVLKYFAMGYEKNPQA